MENKYIDMSLKVFSEELASNKSMPGGGSAAAYSMSLANSLASMVANFTIGKKKYMQFDDETKEILHKVELLSPEILKLVDLDCEAFLELKDVYKMPQDTDEEKALKNELMDKGLKNCASVPYKLLELGEEVLKLHERLLEIGNKMLISDVGVGVILLKAALESAKINILINISGLKDKEYADKMWNRTVKTVENISKKCDEIQSKVILMILPQNSK